MSNKKGLPAEQTNEGSDKVKAVAQAPKKSFVEKSKDFFKRTAKWGRELKSELKKVVWPTKKQVINNTTIVLVVVAIMTIALWVMDLVFERVILNGLLRLITGF